MNLSRYIRYDLAIITALLTVTLFIYFPVFQSDYLYTDESVQLWYYRPGAGYHMFIEQGRYLTDLLMTHLFGRIDTISEVRFLRVFSLVGWMLMIPVWYLILKRVFKKEGLSPWLAPLTVLWLVCSPTFTISIGWASCMELFIAYTAGLVSGYFVWSALTTEIKSARWRAGLLFLSTIAGLVSLFTYQNGFGCFLLPYFIQAVANPGRYRVIIKGILVFFVIAIVYYLLLKLQLRSLGISGSERTAMATNIFSKLKFFFYRPFRASFHFGYLFNERDITGLLAGLLLFIMTVIGYIRLFRAPKILVHIIFLVFLLVLIYLPSMTVKENYASNRTMLALTLAVTCWVLIILSRLLTDRFFFRATWVLLGACFIGNAFFNYNILFRKPLEQEYAEAVQYFNSVYNDSLTSIRIAVPPEDHFVKKFGIVRSWDEFGVPSLFFKWVPAPYFRQLMFERSGDRSRATAFQVEVAPH
ncbi:MAG: hypothetical protein ABWZ25_09050 [Chitinophagaceae bacterium]